MLNIITALSIEAKPIIKKFNLKNQNGIYQNNYINLIITGQGKLKSAINTALLLQKHPYKSLNIGIAGSKTYKKTEGFFIHKITDTDSSLSYYPDFFKENSSELFCVSKTGKYHILTDMESSGFFEACYKFLSVEEIILYKIVSDTPSQPVEKNEIPSLINSHIHIIEKILDTKTPDFFDDVKELLKEANSKMKLTKTQNEELKKMLVFYKLQNKKIPDFPYLKTKKEVRDFLTSLTSSVS